MLSATSRPWLMLRESRKPPTAPQEEDLRCHPFFRYEAILSAGVAGWLAGGWYATMAAYVPALILLGSNAPGTLGIASGMGTAVAAYVGMETAGAVGALTLSILIVSANLLAIEDTRRDRMRRDREYNAAMKDWYDDWDAQPFIDFFYPDGNPKMEGPSWAWPKKMRVERQWPWR